MVSRELAEKMAVAALGLDEDWTEGDVKKAYRKFVGSEHPDQSDDPRAEERFKAAEQAKEILIGEEEFPDYRQIELAQDRMKELVSDEKMSELQREVSSSRGFSSPGGARQDPSGFNAQDFVGVSKEERAQMIKELSLGVEAMMVYDSIQGLFESGYTREDYFDEVNDYIIGNDIKEIKLEHYWEAVGDSVRDDVTGELFVESIEKVQENLQTEYGAGTTLREVANIVAMAIANGWMDMGDVSNFAWDDPFARGGGPFGRDDRFGDDPRYDYGNDPFEGGGHRNRKNDPYGRDPRYD